LHLILALFVYILSDFQKKERKKRKEKKRSAWRRGGGGITKTQHVSGGIPLLREREAAGVGAKGARKARGRKKKKKKKKKGGSFDISLVTTRLN